MTIGTLTTDFAGRPGALFRLALRTGVLTVLTLGVYRFWMKTRLRRYYWSSVRPGGHPLEYVGEPVEKLLGFLIAVVVLAFYIGIVNLILMFFSFALFNGNTVAYAASLAGIVPVWFYALYRARRYVLGRTRWRGMRFGLDPGAWGYAGRALLHWAITILSLGALWPRMTFALEKYRTDRTWIGSFQLEQGGRWTMLYPAYLPTYGAALAIASGAGGLSLEVPGAGWLLLPGLVAIVPGIVYWQVHSTRLLADAKRAGPFGLVAKPRAGRILGIYALGYFVTFLVLGILLMGALFTLATTFGVALGAGAFDNGLPDIPVAAITVFGVVTYFSVFILWGVLRHVFVTLPVWRHYAETLTITGAADLSALHQRDRDAFRDAEGFAEALDLGAAI